MNTNQIHIRKGDVTDLLFRGKNKEYGAYELRRSYSKNLWHSLFLISFIVSAFIVLFSLYNYITNSHSTDTIYHSTEETVFQPDPTIIPKKPEVTLPNEPVTSASKPIGTEILTSPNIVSEVKDSIDLNPTQEILNSDKRIASTQTNGAEGSDMNTLASNTGTGTGISKGDAPSTNDAIYEFTEIDAEFPGGEEALIRFMKNKIVYPEFSLENGITGTVLIRFVVDEEGVVSQFKIIQSVHAELDNEALRVLSRMPRWSPAKQGGQTVKIYKEIPIVFQN